MKNLNKLPIKIFSLILCLLLVTLGCITEPETEEKGLLSIGEENYYAHIISGKTVGYTRYKVTKTQYEKEDVFVIKSKTLLTIVPWKMSYGTTEYYTKDLSPRYYEASISLGERESGIECCFEEGKVKETIESSEGSTEKEISIGKNMYLLDSNVFQHYVFLFRRIRPEETKNVTVSVFNPQQMQSSDITIEFKKEASVLGRSCIYAEATIFQQKHKFWVTEKGELLALEIPSQNFRMELSDASITEKMESVDLIELLSAPSNVAFDDPRLVTHLKIELSAEIAVETVDKDFLSTDYQNFSGTTTNTTIDGVFEIRTEKFSGAGDLYPLSDPQEYLAPEKNIESDDPAIKAKAEEIAEGCKNSWEASRKIAKWVFENISYKITGEGAKRTLETGEGDCGPHAYLTVAMLRSIGIPSRIVGGVIYDRAGGNPIFGQHYWTEVFMDGEWIPFDSTVGEYGYVDATHIRLFQLGGIRSLEVEVLDYTQKEPEIEMKRRETSLKTGEYYQYRFAINDTEFGHADYRAKRKENYEGQEAFFVKLSLDQDLTKLGISKKLELNADLYMTEDVVPLFYSVNALVNEEEQTVECEFSEGKAYDTVTVGEEIDEREIALEEDTYIMGNNMIGLWALMYRSLELKEGESYKISVFFPSRFMKMMVEIEVTGTDIIEVAGESYDCFVCNVPLFKEIDYVTEDGVLVKIDIPSQDAVIELVELES
ncbi:MAG: transglutaminase domain-containing protein [Euryarchaeota archaeon]|nr:transglutaminase domain-containing protein [Euryarchaeota archaeon]